MDGKIILHGEICVTGVKKYVLKRPSVISSGQLIKSHLHHKVVISIVVLDLASAPLSGSITYFIKPRRNWKFLYFRVARTYL